jgi:hypothetical protein
LRVVVAFRARCVLARTQVATADSAAVERAIVMKTEQTQRLGELHSDEVTMLLRLRGVLEQMSAQLAAAHKEVDQMRTANTVLTAAAAESSAQLAAMERMNEELRYQMRQAAMRQWNHGSHSARPPTGLHAVR